MGKTLATKSPVHAPAQLKSKGKKAHNPPAFNLASGPVQKQNPGGNQQTPKQQALAKVATFAADSSTGQAFTNISKADFVAGLRSRINNPQAIDQGALNACGPAAAAYLIAADNPVLFAEFAIELYTTGKGSLGSMTVDPYDGLLTRAPGDSEWGNYTQNNVLDFIILASMRSDKSPFFSQFEDPSNQLAGITLPGTVKEWLNASGTYSDVTDDTSLFGKSFDHFQNTLVPKHTNGHKVVMLIGADMISISRGNAASKKGIKKEDLKKGKMGDKAQTSMPNHYVTFEGNFSVSGDNVSFKIWTWGSTEQITISKTDFAKLYYGGVYAK